MNTKALEYLRARSRISPRGYEHPDKGWSPCRLWTAGTNPSGFGCLRMSRRGRFWFAHRLAWTIEHGPIRKGRHIKHLCGNRTCINPDHLAQVSRIGPRGELACHNVLTPAQVLRIVDDERSITTIANAYGVTHVSIHCIKHGKSWAWLTGISQ